MTHRTIQPLSAVLSDPGEPLTGPTLDLMQSCFSANFRNVRLHRTLASDSANRAIGSFAFTIHEHIGLRAGLDESHGALFNYVLAHELAHVLQKRLPNTSNGRSFGKTVFALEKEAEWAASRAVAGLPVSVCLSDTAEAPRFWGPAGHYYTVYLCSIWAKCSIDQASKNAFYAQMPDQVEELDATAVGEDYFARSFGRSGPLRDPSPDYADPDGMPQMFNDLAVQKGLHALTGANAREETTKRREILENLQPGFAFALALHAFGDSFAHRKADNDECEMYSPPLGHAAERLSFGDPYAPDYVDRQELYLNYGQQMFDILCAKFSKLPKDAKEQRRQKLKQKLLEVAKAQEKRDRKEKLPIAMIVKFIKEETGQKDFKYPFKDEECAPWKVFRSRHPEVPNTLLEVALFLAQSWR